MKYINCQTGCNQSDNVIAKTTTHTHFHCAILVVLVVQLFVVTFKGCIRLY